MKKLLIAALVLASAPAFSHPGLSDLKPLGTMDALSPTEHAEEVFAGEQWAVYKIDNRGLCTGYALANVDTKVYMRIDVRSKDACREDMVIQLAATKAGEYLLKVGDTTTELARQ